MRGTTGKVSPLCFRLFEWWDKDEALFEIRRTVAVLSFVILGSRIEGGYHVT